MDPKRTTGSDKRLSALSGFTLIELLVVVGIIAILAALIIPGIGMIRFNARLAESNNNLKQIGGAIETYRLDNGVPGNDTVWPGRLSTMLGPGQSLEGARKVLTCPLDASAGQDEWMGRSPDWNDSRWCLPLYHGEIEKQQELRVMKPAMSYMYECSDEVLDGEDDEDGVKSWFYAWPVDDSNTSTRPPPDTPTWAQAKLHQVRYGNLNAPFVKSFFPIVRNYHAYNWSGGDGDDDVKMVYNLSWNLNVFSSTTTWEEEAYPGYCDAYDEVNPYTGD